MKLVLIQEQRTGMETVKSILQQNSDCLVQLRSLPMAVPIKLADADAIYKLYQMLDPSRQAKLDRLPFIAIMEIYVATVVGGLMDGLGLNQQAPQSQPEHKKVTWH